MWWTNFLCTSANEEIGTLAEYDPLTVLICRVLAVLLGGREQRVAELPDVIKITTFMIIFFALCWRACWRACELAAADAAGLLRRGLGAALQHSACRRWSSGRVGVWLLE